LAALPRVEWCCFCCGTVLCSVLCHRVFLSVHQCAVLLCVMSQCTLVNQHERQRPNAIRQHRQQQVSHWSIMLSHSVIVLFSEISVMCLMCQVQCGCEAECNGSADLAKRETLRGRVQRRKGELAVAAGTVAACSRWCVVVSASVGRVVSSASRGCSAPSVGRVVSSA